MCYNIGDGAEFKLDVGLYWLDQQVACQRYRQTQISWEIFEIDRNGWQSA